ncbi:MAG: hypothetical protein FWC39_08650 [Bacteroidetes bacterium]|nr:hypothetical protein [Bacteroidota bacterium]
MKVLKTGIFLLISLCFAACSKEEGKGGLASINGVVMVQNVNYHSKQLFGSLQPAQDERVYILYGSNTAIGNDTRTSFDGSFEFPFLVQGNYSVFALSDDTLNVNGLSVEVKKEISLNTKRAKIQADTIILYRFVKFNKGSSVIQGKVLRDRMPLNPPDGLTLENNVVRDTEVYLTLEGSAEILERARTDANGEFKFPNLIPATYRVYTLSSTSDYIPLDVVEEIVTITGDNETIPLDPFIVNKK